MNSEVSNPKIAHHVPRRRLCAALVLTLCALCGAAPANAAHSFFSSGVETLEYPGPERFWNTAGIVISPARTIAQVNTEVPMFAGVCDDHGHLLPYETVEWMLDKSSVGSFVSVSDAYRPALLELLSSKPHKVDNSYAVSETLPANVILTRGTPAIGDDMVMPHGYTWVTVTSAREGVSYVTAYAPDVYGWDARQRSAAIHWIDAQWQFPEPGCVPLGSHASLNTCVYRKTNKTPLADWIVKYTVTGGAEAGFGDERECSTEVATDKEGRASVELVPAGDTPGTTCVCVELIRSECAAIGDPERLSIASSAIFVNWGAKAEQPAAPPSAVVTTPPPATTIAPTPAPQPAAPTAPPTSTTQPTPGPGVTTPSIPPATNIPSPPPAATPKISLDVTGPETAEPGTDVRFIINVANRGTAPVANLVIVDRYDAGLQYAQPANPLQNTLPGTIEPGQSRQVGITFRVTRSGKLCHVVEINGPGIHEVKTSCVNVTAPPPPPEHPAMEVHISAPEDERIRRVGQRVLFTIDAANTGTTVAAQQVRLVVRLEAGLHLEQLSADGKIQNDGTILFSVDNIPPNNRIQRQVECSCQSPTQRACALVDSIDLSKLQLHDEACVQILPAQGAVGAPNALRLSLVASQRNPAKVGTSAIFVVTILNASAEPQKQVQLSVTLPDNMDFATVRRGPTNATIDGKHLQFSAIQELRPREQQSYEIELHAVRAGSSKLEAELTSFGQSEPITGSADALVVN